MTQSNTPVGKYGEETEDIQSRYGAHTVVLLVFGGSRGNGMSVCSVDEGTNSAVPDLLRIVADEIDKEFALDKANAEKHQQQKKKDG